MASPNNGDHKGGAPRHVHIEKNKKTNWLPWLLLGLGVLALLFALSRCGRDDEVVTNSKATAVPAEPKAEVVAATPNAAGSAALVGTTALGGFLAGNEPTPRSFVFEKLNFDTAESEVRAVDAAEIDQVAATLKQYGTAKVRIAGYADARGNGAANAALGKARAESVKSALVAKGIDAGRIETVSGGENDPVDTNATASGQFENRRTELAVTSR
jgi:outer membrane protein OmpA-like peptidoglycan-associated protein